MASTVRTDKVGPVSGSADFTLPTADGTAGQFLKTDGSLALSFATVAVTGLNSIQVFTASGTWTRPTGITKVIVEVQGGGGGGSRATANPSVNGGSAGGYAKKFLDVSSIATATITIGAAGEGKETVNGIGTDGGDSSWVDGTNTITGVKGVAGYSSYGQTVGGLGTGGDINIQGGFGINSVPSRAGDSQFGHGGVNGWTAETVPGAGIGYGSGGGGGYSLNGADGAPGIIVVHEYK